MRLPMLSISCLSMLFLAGCGKPEIVPMNGDTYLVSKRSAQVGFGPPEGAKRDAYQAANEFAAAKGMVVETVSFEMTNSGFARPGSVALQFRCVPAPKAGGAKAEPTSTGSTTEKKLEDLKAMLAKGLITQDDFDQKKKEILAQM